MGPNTAKCEMHYKHRQKPHLTDYDQSELLFTVLLYKAVTLISCCASSITAKHLGYRI